MRLLNDNILGLPIKEEKTSSGIINAESEVFKNKVKVILTGPKVKFVKIGDIVHIYKHAGVKLDHEGKEHLLLKENSEVSVIE